MRVCWSASLALTVPRPPSSCRAPMLTHTHESRFRVPGLSDFLKLERVWLSRVISKSGSKICQTTVHPYLHGLRYLGPYLDGNGAKRHRPDLSRLAFPAGTTATPFCTRCRFAPASVLRPRPQRGGRRSAAASCEPRPCRVFCLRSAAKCMTSDTS